MENKLLIGMPYVPGVATGRVHIGTTGVDARCIALITQQQIDQIKNRPAGLLVEEAAPFSHTLIGLLGLGVPTVLITSNQAVQLRRGMTITLDGRSGVIATDQAPSPAAVPAPPAGQAVRSADGKAVNLYASVRNPDAAQRAVQNGAGAIGLVRSEYLLPPDKRPPDTDFYRQAFTRICAAARPLTVTIRLLDVAADKVPPWLSSEAKIGGPLGRQGVRLYSLPAVKDVVAAQLQALSELADTFSLRLLIPYLVRGEELAHWLEFVRPRMPDSVPIGAMVETPAGALDVARWLARADFVAIGCNDLMQCLFAVDRDDASLRQYLDPYAPVLYRFLRDIAFQVSGECHRLQLCGVLSQLQGVLPVLLGLGYRTFSVDAPFIPYHAHAVAQQTMVDCETLARQVCDAGHTHEVRHLLGLAGDAPPPFVF